MNCRRPKSGPRWAISWRRLTGAANFVPVVALRRCHATRYRLLTSPLTGPNSVRRRRHAENVPTGFGGWMAHTSQAALPSRSPLSVLACRTEGQAKGSPLANRARSDAVDAFCAIHALLAQQDPNDYLPVAEHERALAAKERRQGNLVFALFLLSWLAFCCVCPGWRVRNLVGLRASGDSSAASLFSPG